MNRPPTAPDPPLTFEDRIVNEISQLRVWIAALALAVAIAIAFGAYGLATANTASEESAAVAHRVAALASRKAKTANDTSQYTLTRLQTEADGECYRVNYLRWQIDRTAYAGWKRDTESAQFLFAIHEHHTTVLALAFRGAARAWRFLPLTTCSAATGSPATYRPPGAIGFSHVPRRELRRVLDTPPQPPAA